MYAFDPGFLDALPHDQPASLEKEIFPHWIGAGIHVYPVHGDFIDIGTPESYRRAQSLFGEKDVSGAIEMRPAPFERSSQKVMGEWTEKGTFGSEDMQPTQSPNLIRADAIERLRRHVAGSIHTKQLLLAGVAASRFWPPPGSA